MEKDNKEIKLAFIFGEMPVDGVNRNGEVDYIYMDDDDYHISYLIEYFKAHFKNDSYLQSINLSIPAHIVEIYLSKQSHIVFVNSTSYINGIPPKTGKSGVLILPENLTREQINSLTNFKNDIIEYTEVQIWSDFYYDDDGILTGKLQSSTSTGKTVSEFIHYYIEKTDNIRQK